MSGNFHVYSNQEVILNCPGTFMFKFENSKVVVSPKLIREYKSEDLKVILENISCCFNDIKKNLRTIHSEEFLLENYGRIIKSIDNFVCSKYTFPGLQIVAFNKNLLNICALYNQRILITEKSDGVRYMMLFLANGKTLLFNRKDEFYLVETLYPLPYNKSFFNKGSWEIIHFLDGELILDSTFNKQIPNVNEKTNTVSIKSSNINSKHNELFKLKFLVFDALIIDKNNIGHLKFRDRLSYLNNFENYYNQGRLTRTVGYSNFVMKMSDFCNSITNNIQKNKINHDAIEDIEEIECKETNGINGPNIFKENIDLIIKNMSNHFGNNDDIIKEYKNNNKEGNDNKGKLYFDIFFKNYYDFSSIYSIYKNKDEYLHANDGVIINYDDYPYYVGKSDHIFKWKPSELNTIDFELKKEDGFYTLNICESREKIVPVSVLLFKSENDKIEFDEKYNNLITSGKTQMIVECKYDRSIDSKEAVQFNKLLGVKKFVDETNNSIDLSFYKEKLKNIDKEDLDMNNKNFYGGWKIIRIRTDKYYGNYMNTYKQTVLSIKENLDIGIIDEVNKKIKSSIESLSKDGLFQYSMSANKVMLTGNKNLYEDSSKYLKEVINVNVNSLLDPTEKELVNSDLTLLDSKTSKDIPENLLGNKRDKTDDLNKIMEICINKSNTKYKKEHLNKCLDS